MECEFHDITTLSLADFITCLCDGKLNRVIIAGQPSPDELQAAWGSIYQDYCDCIKSNTQITIEQYQKSIIVAQTRFNTIALCLFRLRLEYNRDIALELKRHVAIKIADFENTDEEQYDHALEIASSKSKLLVAEIDKLKKELAAIIAKNQTQKALTKRDFSTMIMSISAYLGFQVDKFKISLSEFIEAYVDMKNAIEAKKLEKFINKHQSHGR